MTENMRMHHAAFLDKKVAARAENYDALAFAIRVIQRAKKDLRPVKRGIDRGGAPTPHQVESDLGAVQFTTQAYADLAREMAPDLRRWMKVFFAMRDRHSA